MYWNMIDPKHEIPDDIVSSLLIFNSFFTSNFIGNSLIYFDRLMIQHHK